MNLTDPPEKAFEADNGNDATGRDPESGKFLVGHKRSRGRPKGSRARLSEKFFAALHDDFEENGVAAIARMRFHDPSTYVSVIAKLMPQKLEITTPTDGMTDDRLAELLDYAERMAAAHAGMVIEGQMRNVTPALPPIAPAPATEAAQRAEQQRQGLNEQHDALDAVAPVIPPPTLPHPVGRAVPPAHRTVERRNVAKLDDEINPEDLF